MEVNKNKELSPVTLARLSKKFLLYVNNFCPRRSLDTSRFYEYFLANGWQPTSHIKEADLIFIYSCGVFNSSEKRTLNTINKVLKKKSPHSKIVVSGCLVKIHRKVLHGNYIILGTEEINALDEIIDAKIKIETIPDTNHIYPIKDLISPRQFLIKKFKMDFNLDSFFFKKVKSLFFGRTKYKKTWSIKIAEGCLGNCSYCALKFAAGRIKSKNPDTIIEEFNQGLKRDQKTFVLINTDVGSYGRDIGTNIVELLKRMFAIKGDYKIRLIDFNPRWLVRYFDKLLPLLKKHSHKVAYMSMPIQSGSDRILRLMKRPYKISDIKATFSGLKAQIPGLVINTHFIVGFPGETNQDFEQTQKLAQMFDFGRISVHPYHDRPNTKSSKIPDKVPEKVIFKRYRALRLIS